jgi:hypothetical protein
MHKTLRLRVAGFLSEATASDRVSESSAFDITLSPLMLKKACIGVRGLRRRPYRISDVVVWPLFCIREAFKMRTGAHRVEKVEHWALICQPEPVRHISLSSQLSL